MIEVRLTNGDSAEAETPDEAVYAAETMIGEALLGGARYSFAPTATFVVEGRVVRERVTREQLRVLARTNGA